MPEALVNNVREAMEQGDVVKALNHCEEEPGLLASILSAGFSAVEEGFEAVEDSIGVVGDMESERLLQRVNYLNVVGNLAPMLGLLGTVMGMIKAFASLGTMEQGAAQQAFIGAEYFDGAVGDRGRLDRGGTYGRFFPLFQESRHQYYSGHGSVNT